MDFISILSIFVLACFVGYFVVWSVTPALHTPLMAVTNAISSVIIVGALIAAGLLVGVGTRYGSGCTSGHGVCGLARLSPRSMLATVTFMAAGAATVFATRHIFSI